MRAFRKERPPADPTKLSDYTRAEQLLKEVRWRPPRACVCACACACACAQRQRR